MSYRVSHGTWHTSRGRSRSRCFLCWTRIITGDRYYRSASFSDYNSKPYTIVEHRECLDALKGLGPYYFDFLNEEGIPERCLSGEYVDDEELPADFVAWRDLRIANEDQ